MPQSIKKHLTKDLLGSLDPDIVDVEHRGSFLKLTCSYGEFFTLSEQDLVTLLNFIRETKQ